MNHLDRKLRVLVLTSTFPRWAHDTEPRFVLDLCRHLQKDTDVLVLAPHAPGAALQETLEGVPVRRFRYFFPPWQAVNYQGGIMARLRAHPWRLMQLPFFLFTYWWQTRQLVRSWAPDVIHAHWIIPQGLIACMAARRVPVLCTSHGGDLHGLRGPVFRRIKAWVLNRCRSMTAVSQSMVGQVHTLAPEIPIEVIPMGTDLNAAFTPPASPDTRDHNHILFVGRLVEKKGVRYLLQALAVLLQELPDLKLTIVGDGPLEKEIRLQVNELGLSGSVLFAGSIPHRDLPEYYRRATLAVFPFVVAQDGDQEGFGLVVVEAMGCGCPVIASDLPAIRQSIEPGITGLLVPPGDTDALADAIRQSMENESMRSRLSSAALQRARERFSWEATALRYRQVLVKCLEGHVYNA